MRKRRTVEGYLDMGRPQVPPIPMNIIMEDRINATAYWLTYTGSAGTLTIALSTDLPTGGFYRYTSYAGPYVNANRRLFITGGVLSVETADTSYYNGRVFARRGNETTILEVTAPAGVLTYTEVDLAE